ncbi:pyridoxal phosphate-dependent aminotransferase [Helicovermis profundi]|uniref:Aminotransferase n=1 Tax=Helicovermis profundi TaxID=3065157 RepID=A0AAU9E387_9FIRM|nr:pyridoxal phosphate-dependent aminotransferase [Clostridia bacterium S502]
MFSKKISNISPSFTIGISTKVKELKNSGIDILNLSIGEPDFLTPENAKNAAIEAIHNNITKYDAAAGNKEFRKAIIDKLKKENNLEYDIDQIVISNGAKHAITNTLIALLNPEDEVIIPKPYWVSYPEMVKLTGGVPIFVDTKKENNFKLTKEELIKSITNKTKAIFITNPSNPTGAVYTKEELIEIANICVENKIFILADEIYERILYVDNFTSIASLSKDIYNYTITINGLSKSAAMTGWRLGYTACRKDLAKIISSIQGHLVSHPCTVSQAAGKEALISCTNDTKKMLEGYTKRRNLAIKMFNKIDEIDIIQPDGAFYIFMDISKIKKNVNFKDSFSIEVCNVLLDKFKLALVPGIAFGNDDFLRMSYAADINDVEEGINRIAKYIETVKK